MPDIKINFSEVSFPVKILSFCHDTHDRSECGMTRIDVLFLFDRNNDLSLEMPLSVSN